jgi:hypothetical protein
MPYRLMRNLLLTILSSFFFLFLFSTVKASDNTSTHIVVFVNQVRGPECCDTGNLKALETQIRAFQENKLQATFAVRFDALNDTSMRSLLLQAANQGQEMGALLEVTPSLAQASGVMYNGKPEQWYEAQTVFLVGYTPSDRQKIIDTYMMRYKEVFHAYPYSSVAWMIDPISLSYMKKTYGVMTHELTREQWGTDSYTLYGGPPHYAYVPSEKWALIPSKDQQVEMPLIIRQTVTDPVWNYGDPTSSYTSQPNDYASRKVDFNYFKHLFYQAHEQPTENYTLTILGLENSMADSFQQEYRKQIKFVHEWKTGQSRQVLTAQNFNVWWKGNVHPKITIYQGKSDDSDLSKAWWVTTPSYRMRLRADHGSLFISDLRLYDESETDPYLTTPAKRFGYWTAPFLVDGSRFLEGDESYDFFESIHDNITNRKEKYKTPTRIEISSSLSNKENSSLLFSRNGEDIVFSMDGTPLINFKADSFELKTPVVPFMKSAYLKDVLDIGSSVFNWTWKDRQGQKLWGCFGTSSSVCVPTLNIGALESEREQRYPLLFPQLQERTLDVHSSYVYINNRYAIAGRNPVRIVFYPRDTYGYPAALSELPVITTDTPITYVGLEKQHGGNGMIFIDLINAESKKVQFTLQSQSYTQTSTVFFAPDCKQLLGECLKHPSQLYWYLSTIIDDRLRGWKEKH